MPIKRIYIAGAFEDKSFLRFRRDEIEAIGHVVTSSWLDETLSTNPGLAARYVTDVITPEAARAIAVRDLSEVHASDVLLIDTNGTNVRMGREVEFGYALAHGEQTIQTVIVGPRRNVFHELAGKQFGTWKEALKWLTKSE